MKYIIRAVSILILLLGLSSCEKPADTDPVDQDQRALSQVMYASRDAKLRSGPGVESDIVAMVLRGEPVTVFSTVGEPAENECIRVSYKIQYGYINASFLSEKKPLSYERLAWCMMKTMTTEEKVGQLFFLRCRKDTAVEDLKAYSPGGYILFASDIRDHTKESLKTKIQSYQDASGTKLLIGVDEEGGGVVRVSKYPGFRAVPFQSPQALYAEGGFDLIAGDTREKAQLLKSLGINVNLAPVCDISEDPADYIYARTFGKNAEETAAYVKTVVDAMNSEGIGCALKHFPGYGNNPDTHTGIAVDNRSYDSFTGSDFMPFRAGIEAGAGSVLISHNIITSMDERLPASLSPAVHRILRDDLGFKGVIMTDDLEMEGIRKLFGDEESAIQAILAGNDLIISSSFDVQIPSVLSAVESGAITEAHVEKSVMKVLAWKLRLGIIPL